MVARWCFWRAVRKASVFASFVVVGWRWCGRPMRAKYCDSWEGEYVGLDDLSSLIVVSL